MKLLRRKFSWEIANFLPHKQTDMNYEIWMRKKSYSKFSKSHSKFSSKQQLFAIGRAKIWIRSVRPKSNQSQSFAKRSRKLTCWILRRTTLHAQQFKDIKFSSAYVRVLNSKRYESIQRFFFCMKCHKIKLFHAETQVRFSRQVS